MKLLLVEDDISLSKVLRIALELEGYSVDYALDGKTGYQKAKNNAYDVIILDLTLPKMSGTKVCSNLRSDGVDVPIIVLTGVSTTDATVKSLDMGADDYVTKPFADGELYARIRAVLRRRVEPNNQLLKVGDLKLNKINRQVYREGQTLKLMPKEYELLKYLMNHKNQALPRQQILRDVWHIKNRNTSNRLDVYIKHLRRKIDQPGRAKLLHTVRNVGYMISDQR